LATSNSSKLIKIRVDNILTKCISTLLLRGLAANPNEDNAININQQDQNGAAKACVGPNPQVQEILKNCRIGLKHMKVKATSLQVKVAKVKAGLEEAMKDQ
jgi:hypothetical protein